MKFVTKGDRLVILTAVVFAIFSYIFFNFTVFARRPQTAEVFVDGKLYASYKLGEIQGAEIVEIKTEYGSNTIEITADGVRAVNASCPDKNDVKSGKITKTSQMIICVPNRFSVKLTGGNTEADKVTY